MMNEEKSSSKKITSVLWNKTIFLASALMNAISLINIGRDLKITLIRWSEFFEVSFEFTRKIVGYFIYPFSALLSLFSIQIPSIVRNTYMIAFLTSFVWFKAIVKVGNKLNNKNDLFAPSGLGLLFSIPTALIVASFQWIFILLLSPITSYPDLISFSFFVVLITIVYLSLFRKHKHKSESLAMNIFLDYMKTIVLIVTIIYFVNYFIITFE